LRFFAWNLFGDAMTADWSVVLSLSKYRSEKKQKAEPPKVSLFTPIVIPK
jgi:hypothetical protein